MSPQKRPKKRAPRTSRTRTEKRDALFFTTLASTGKVNQAARVAGYGRTTVYDRRKTEPDFCARWEEAEDEYTEQMETEADRRALEGVRKPVYYQGVQVGEVQEYSDALLMFRLKARRPDLYRERASYEHTGKDGRPLPASVVIYMPANGREEHPNDQEDGS